MSEKEQLSAMLQELQARCPTLCPAVVPAGCDDRESGTAMLALSRDAQERQALVSLLSSARRAATHCALTDRETPEQDLRFVAFWQLDAARATYRLTRCAFVCTEAATLLDVPGFLQRFTKPGSDTAQLTALAHLFCHANGQQEHGAKALQARLAQERTLTRDRTRTRARARTLTLTLTLTRARTLTRTRTLP